MRVEAHNLVKRFGELTAVQVERLLIRTGSITGIAGANGAGKSTLLGIMSGLDVDYEGQIRYDEKPFCPEVRRDVTMVFQNPYMLAASVVDNVAYPLRLRKAPRQEYRRTSELWIERLGLTHLRRKNARNLSGGEMQRVAIARALAFSPRLLLLDEPTSSVDSEFTNRVEEEITSFSRLTGATVVIISHDHAQLERICDHMIHMDHGKIVEQN